MAIRFATTGHFKGRSSIAKSGYGPAAGARTHRGREDAYGVKVLASAAFTQGLVSRGVISLGMG